MMKQTTTGQRPIVRTVHEARTAGHNTIKEIANYVGIYSEWPLSDVKRAICLALELPPEDETPLYELTGRFGPRVAAVRKR